MVKMRLLASLVVLALFLFMANPCVGASGRGMVVVFKGDKTEVPFEEDDGAITVRKPRAFRVPAFVGGIFNDKEFLVLLCDARYYGFSDWSFIEPAAKTSYDDYTKWSDAEIISKNTRKNSTHSVLGDLTAVMKGNKIYVLAPSWDSSPTAWVNHKSDTGWDPLMIVGTVMNRPESEGGGVHVKWEKKGSLKGLLPNTVLGAKGFQFIGGVGNGVVTKSGTIIFPIQIANNRRQSASSIMYSTDDGVTWKMGGTTWSGPSESSVTEWKDGKLILSARYEGGFRKVYESDDMGTTWKESTMFSRVWGNQQNRRGVGSQGSLITVPVDGENVLLFSHPLNKLGRYKRDTLQLWMSDGQRIVCVGTISEKGKGERSGYSILAHVGDHLYSMHEINPYGEWKNYDAALEEWDRILALSPLTDLFDSVKNTARGWRKVDKELNAKSVPTNGLVGFLADSNDDTVWEDKYNCVHANVNGATRVQGGFRFDDTPDSGAKWPVQSQGQNQFYIFTEKHFTLAATITIHSTKESGDHLLLGASKDAAGTQVLLGIGYTQGKKWYALHSAGVKLPTQVSIELEKEYHVVITFVGGVGSVYVDGVAIISGQKLTDKTASINHFFMGGIGKSSTAKGYMCTVKNVMLFNRVLNQAEITEIKNVNKYISQTEPVVRTEPTDIVVDPKSTSKTEPTATLNDPKSTSATEPTVAVEDPKSTSTREPIVAVEDPKSTSTTEPTVAVEDSKSTSTTEPTVAVEDPKSTSTTEPTVAVEDSKSTSTTEPTVAVEDPKSTSTTEPTVAVEDPKSTSTTEPTVAVEDPKSTSTTEPPVAVEDPKSTSTTKPTVAVEDPKSTSATETTVAVEDPKSTSTTEPPVAVEDPKSTSTTEPTEKKAVDGRSFPNKDGNYESEKSEFITRTSTTENPSEEDTRIDGAVGLISFTAWICVVNSAIVLAGL